MAGVTRPKVDSVSPGELVDWARAGRIRIPTFQRSYKWDRRDVVELFNSVFRGYPIGNLLVWRRTAPAELVILGHLQIAAEPVNDALVVVDGQQRTISLVGALTATAETVDPRFRIYFDLSKGEFVSATRSQKHANDWLPVYIAFDTVRTNAWIRARPELSESKIELADQVVAAIRDYKIPMYIVTSDDDRALRDIFDRMNNFGKPLKSAEIFNALHSVPDEPDPNDLHTLARRVRTFGFGDFPESVLMQSLLAIRNPLVDRDFRHEFSDATDRHEAFIATAAAIGCVVDFMRGKADIPHVKLVPYTLYIPVLSRFVSIFGLPVGRAAELLRRWIWRGAVLGPAPQGNTIGIRQGASAIHDDPVESANRLLSLLPAPNFTEWSPDLSQIGLNRAKAKINILGMFSLHPLIIEPDDMTQQTPANISDLLDSGRVLVTIIPNATTPLGKGLANRLVHPIPKASILSTLIQRNLDARTLASHCLDEDAIGMLRAGQIDEFLEWRASRLSEVIARYVQDRALFGFRDGPDLSNLFDDPQDYDHAE